MIRETFGSSQPRRPMHAPSCIKFLRQGLAPFALLAAAQATPALADNVSIDVAIVQRAVSGDGNVVRVTEGDSVTLQWSTDEATEIHLHGYNVSVALIPGEVGIMTVDATATGRFPVTSHGFEGAHVHGEEATLLYLEVYPD